MESGIGNAESRVENLSKGERTRQAILESAVNIASTEGLEGLSIGRLAIDLSMSKSGLFAHFGSKQDLQLATLDAARSIFIREVVLPSLEAGPGIQLLWRLCEMWFDYLGREVFRGGCFFVAAASEFDGRPGRVHDRIGEIMKEWLDGIEGRIREAQQLKHIDEDLDPEQLAFEINAIEMGSNLAFQLFKDEHAVERGRHGVLERLRSRATKLGLSLLTSTSPIKQSTITRIKQARAGPKA